MEGDWNGRISLEWEWQSVLWEGIQGHLRGSMKTYYSRNFLKYTQFLHCVKTDITEAAYLIHVSQSLLSINAWK